MQNHSENTPQQNKPHKRRPHYSGRYPRKFEEKYKELNPDKYGDTIEKVIKKGSTPAGMHIPIMVNEILDFLQIRPGQKGLDCTLGYGGHSSKMAAALRTEDTASAGHLYALDYDPIEIEKTVKRMRDLGFDENIFTAVNENFRNIDKIAQLYGPFDFILADLGVSSMQIDNPERGFSYKTDGPLDLRFNPNIGESAAERLCSLDRDSIAYMLAENSDEPYADRIASAIHSEYSKKGRKPSTIATTADLYRIIENTVRKIPASKLQEKTVEDAVKKASARTFQALRIDVNSEFEVLYEFLEKLPDALAPGGRCAVLTFHSGEDRLVKKAFKSGLKSGIFSEISEDVTRPSKEECYYNPRARSTKLRWAVRAD